MAIKFVLANFLYSPPELMQIADPEYQLPNWLLADYKALYEQNDSTVNTAQSQQPAQPTAAIASA